MSLHAIAVGTLLLISGVGGSRAATTGLDDPLPRRAWLGVALEPTEGGARVRSVMPGGSAEAAGLKIGDVITRIADTPTATVPAALAVLRPVKGGDAIDLELQRDGKPETARVEMKGWPREPETDAYRVEYASVPSTFGRLRTITLVPKSQLDPGQKRPALLIVQGLGAATLDNSMPGQPIDQPIGMGAYRTIADALANAGYVVVRVDKGGCGDSEGDARALDFTNELDGYRQALKALVARDDVDRGNVFIFGHSMGGAFGPMLAAETPAKGVAVYGTFIKTWPEYLAENSRRQALLAGASPAEYDQQARVLEKFNHEYLVNKKSPDQVLKEFSELTGALDDLGIQGDQLFGRNYRFFQQLYDVNLPEYWAKLDSHVLALWGVAEIVTSRDDHEVIAGIANDFQPGHGTFVAVPESDHGFDRAATPAEALQASQQTAPGAPSRFNPEIITLLRDWMNKCRS